MCHTDNVVRTGRPIEFRAVLVRVINTVPTSEPILLANRGTRVANDLWLVSVLSTIKFVDSYYYYYYSVAVGTLYSFLPVPAPSPPRFCALYVNAILMTTHKTTDLHYSCLLL